LAPALANAVIEKIAALGITASEGNDSPLTGLPYPGVALPVWDTL
jgi:hypothetical protein